MPLFPCDPQALINSAVCFDKCIPPGAQREVALYLLCQWANAASAPTPVPPPPPAPEFSCDPATTVIIWIDKNGYQNGNLAAFNATADAPSVTTLLLGPGVTSATGFAHFPLLSNIAVGYGLTVFWVNSILVELAAMFSVNGPTNIDLSGQAPPAPPDSGPPDGLTAYNYLANMPGVDIRTD
jgi:hypothetical protein